MANEPIDLGALQRELEAATAQWQDAEKETSYARGREVTALNRLNAAQKAFDAAVAKLKEKAPRDSDWVQDARRKEQRAYVPPQPISQE